MRNGSANITGGGARRARLMAKASVRWQRKQILQDRRDEVRRRNQELKRNLRDANCGWREATEEFAEKE
jgi:hypothetical protein